MDYTVPSGLLTIRRGQKKGTITIRTLAGSDTRLARMDRDG